MAYSPAGKQFMIAVGTLLAIILLGAVLFLVVEGRNRHDIGDIPPSVLEPFAAQFGRFERVESDSPWVPAIDVYNLNDVRVPWSALRGRVVLVNFWASWCPPCLEELPSLQTIQLEKGHDGFAVAYVSFDFVDSGAELVQIMQENHLPAIDTTYVNDPGAWAAYEIKALPTTLLLDRDGKLVFRMVGDIDWEGPEARAFIDAVLAE